MRRDAGIIKEGCEVIQADLNMGAIKERRERLIAKVKETERRDDPDEMAPGEPAVLDTHQSEIVEPVAGDPTRVFRRMLSEGIGEDIQGSGDTYLGSE